MWQVLQSTSLKTSLAKDFTKIRHKVEETILPIFLMLNFHFGIAFGIRLLLLLFFHGKIDVFYLGNNRVRRPNIIKGQIEDCLGDKTGTPQMFD